MSIEFYPSIAKVKRNGTYQNLPGFVPPIGDENAEQMIATAESSNTAQYEHNKDYYFRLNGTLYKATEKINVGDEIAVGVNCEVSVLSNDVAEIGESYATHTKIADPALDGNDNYFFVTQNFDSTTNGVRRTNVDGKLRLSGTATATRYANYFNGTTSNLAASSTFIKNVPVGIYKVSLKVTGKVPTIVIRYSYTTVTGGTKINDGDTLFITEPAGVYAVIQNNTNYGNLSSGESTLIDLKLKRITPIYEMIQGIKDENNNIKVYTNFVSGYYNTSGSTIDVNTITPNSSWNCIAIDCEPFDRFIIQAWGGDSSQRTYHFLQEDGTKYPSNVDYSNDGEYTILACNAMKEIIAPRNASKLIVNNHIRGLNGYDPKVYKLSKNDILNKMGYRGTGELPYKAKYFWMNKVVSVYENMIAINDNGVLKLSKDNGNTWNQGINVSAVGAVRKAHLYANGCLGFFTDTKAYYIESEWTGYNEASCYEADGSAYTPMETGNFSFLYDHRERKFLDSQDMYVFNNYNENSTFRKLVWYSIDNGHSYKIAYEFDIEDAIPARHIHEAIYYSPEDTYIVCTGDTNATECNVCGFVYDSTNDTWTVTKIAGSSRDYKWGNVAIYAQEIYYNYDSTPGKVMKCKFDDIADISKHITILDNMESDAVGLVIGRKGDMIVTQSTYRSTGSDDPIINMTRWRASRLMYYSSDGKSFNKFILPLSHINGAAVYNKTFAVSNTGQCFISAGAAYPASISVDDFLSTQGFPNAFKVF